MNTTQKNNNSTNTSKNEITITIILYTKKSLSSSAECSTEKKITPNIEREK